MALTNKDMSLAGGLLKTYYTGPVRDQLNNDTILMKRLKRNTSDIEGGAAVIGLHTSRNSGVGSRGAVMTLPPAGKQGHAQATVPLKFHYGRGQVTGPDINKTKGNKGAFAKVVDTEVQGLVRDLSSDINRQMFSDGSGFLCLSYASAGSPLNIIPYLWTSANKYLVNGQYLQAIDYSTTTGTANTQLPAQDDTGAISVTSSTATALTYGGTWTTLGAGDPIGKHLSLMLPNGSGAQTTRYEMMGLWGIIHDTNLVFDPAYQYDLNNGVANFTNPEGAAYSFAADSGYNLNYLQGIDANASDYWRAYCKGNGGVLRALDLSLMDDMFGYLQTNQGSRPSLIVTTYQQQIRYADLVRADRRFPNVTTLDGGFKAVEYNGIPIVADKDCPRGTMFFVDESQLSLYVGEEFNWIEDGSGNPLHYISGYDAFEMVLRYYAELGCHRRNVHGKIYDLLD